MLLNPYLGKWLDFQKCWGSRNSYQESHLSSWAGYHFTGLGYIQNCTEKVSDHCGGGGGNILSSVKAEGTGSIGIHAERTFSCISALRHALDLWHALFHSGIITSVVFVFLNRTLVCFLVLWPLQSLGPMTRTVVLYKSLFRQNDSACTICKLSWPQPC